MPGWTPDQEAEWQLMVAGRPPKPRGDQTPEQALNLAVDSFRYACSLDVDPPAREAVEARMRAEFGTGRW
jgi:hypothetical protein